MGGSTNDSRGRSSTECPCRVVQGPTGDGAGGWRMEEDLGEGSGVVNRGLFIVTRP